MDINLIKCTPPGSMSTCIDVNVDNGDRWCGMCAIDLKEIKLHSLCPHCFYYLSYFQIMTDCTAIGEVGINSEKKLETYTKKYKKEQQERWEQDDDGFFGDMSEADYY